MSVCHPTPEQLAHAHLKVRELYWAINSPALLKSSANLPMTDPSFWKEQTKLALPLISDLLNDPSPIIKQLDTKRKTKIGLVFEDLLLFWFQNHPTWQLIAHDEQIFFKKETLGALDFVIQTETKILHLEVAVKFYLCQNNSSAWEHWVGPSLKDNLYKKMQRLKTHQIPIAKRAETIKHFSFRKMPVPTDSLAVVKGVFFNRWAGPLVAPHFGKLPTGTWLFADELDSYLLDKENQMWVERHRPDWLAPSLSTTLPRGYSHTQMHSIRVLKPRMFSTVLHENDLWMETERIVVVPNHWSAS